MAGRGEEALRFGTFSYEPAPRRTSDRLTVDTLTPRRLAAAGRDRVPDAIAERSASSSPFSARSNCAKLAKMLRTCSAFRSPGPDRWSIPVRRAPRATSPSVLAAGCFTLRARYWSGPTSSAAVTARATHTPPGVAPVSGSRERGERLGVGWAHDLTVPTSRPGSIADSTKRRFATGSSPPERDRPSALF
jgi:hypothetical protein